MSLPSFAVGFLVAALVGAFVAWRAYRRGLRIGHMRGYQLGYSSGERDGRFPEPAVEDQVDSVIDLRGCDCGLVGVRQTDDGAFCVRCGSRV